ncbi:F-box domain-containing protein [Mycena chlorophos]|uniref:F-box domain-containing protein n=1 Tax=Mycena chlorophos TaxID=658473 RepID=A0A8H6W277_MYCCL|nr:F-box domain-containing protein [Mycena chlorophos]
MTPSSTPWNELRAVLAEPSSSNFRERVLRSMLRDAENNVHALDAEMAALSRRREQEQARITSLKDALAPLRKLSTELAVKIFSEVEHGPKAKWRGDNEFFRVLFALSAVCSHWRSMILSNPSLWAQDTLCIGGTKSVKLVKCVLRRSAPLPISIHFRDDVRDIGDQLLAAVAKSAPRWRSLSCMMELQHSALMPLLLHSEPWGWPCLKNLNLFPGTSGSLFADAPALLQVSFRAGSISQVPLLPWGQLQDLKLDVTNFDLQNRNVWGTIVLCPSLVALDVRLNAWEHSQDVDFPDATLLHLSKLHLEVTIEDPTLDEHFTVAPFFVHFTFPVLQTLSIQMEEEYFPDPTNIIETALGTGFISFLGRSSQLESLELSFCLLDPDFLRDILASTPSLTKLSIEYPLNELDDTLFEHLTYSPSRSVVAPRLHTLRLVGMGTQFTAKALVELIHSRWWTDGAPMLVARWQHVSVFCREDDEGPAGLYDLEVDFKETVLALRDQGLRLETNFPPPWSRWDYDDD